MPSAETMRDLFAEKARAGDGSFAVAWALMHLADAQLGTAAAIQRLGVGSASTHFGAIEALAMEVTKVAEALNGISGSISEHTAAVPD